MSADEPRPCGESSDYLIALRDGALRDAPVEHVPVDTLVVDYTPRTAGEDEEHVRTLAESVTPWPPILVHRPTMTVVDGVHRLAAARLRGEERTAVRFFDGDVQDALLLAVAANVTHGRPLSVADRTAAAERIFRVRPQWSDRAVAAVAGLSARKVAQIRRGFAADAGDGERRVGRDGRARPVSSAQGRELASELIRRNPDASLRQIARSAGISPATVADVRDRLSRGEDPLPPRQRLGPPAPADDAGRGPEGLSVVRDPEDAPQHASMSLLRPPRGRQGAGRGPRAGRGPGELMALFDSLRRDPSLRLNEAGRNVLRILDACACVVRDRRRIVDTVPTHCKEPMSQLVDGYAEIWQLLADDLRRAGMGDAGMEPSSLGA